MWWRSLSLCVLTALPVAAACSFDKSGVGGDDDDDLVVADAARATDASARFDAAPGTPDAAGPGPDAPVGPPDAPAPPPDAPAPPPDAPAPPPDAAADTDMDGILDAVDNCPLTPNPGQLDEESDGVGNLCDNCPSVANPGQENVLESAIDRDGVGDACDPRPTLGGDSIAMFDGFDALRGGWTVGQGTSTWSVSGGVLSQTDDTGTSGNIRILYWADDTFGDAVVETTAVIDGFSGTFTTPYRTVGAVASYDDNGGADTGYGCVQLRQNGAPPDLAAILTIDGAAAITATSTLGWTMNTTDRVRTLLYTEAAGGSQACDLENLDTGAASGATDTDTAFTGSHVGLRTYRVRASFEYLLVYSLGGTLP